MMSWKGMGGRIYDLFYNTVTLQVWLQNMLDVFALRNTWAVFWKSICTFCCVVFFV